MANKNGFWDKETVVGYTNETGKSATRVAICEREGKTFVDARKFVKKNSDTYNQHTTKGLSMEINSPEDLLELIETLGITYESLKAKGVTKKPKSNKSEDKNTKTSDDNNKLTADDLPSKRPQGMSKNAWKKLKRQVKESA